jgi:outer membrane protein assembly factor BamB
MLQIFAIILLLAVTPTNADEAKDILQATGVKGGLVVHVGCGDGKLTAALRANERYVVHGLDRDAEKVEQARRHIEALRLYGPVSVDRLNGKELPYVPEVVNLLIASDLGETPMDEVLRVLAPDGVAYVRQGEEWKKTVKPRPAGIDEWSHFLHDAGGNAVANDSQVGPPKALRWVAGPLHCRSHEFPSSVNAVVVGGGRIFTIFDEAPAGVFKKLPQRCSLIARDAFSGLLLWKVPMQDWQPEFGTGEAARWGIHHTIPRRLIAEGNRVYVTLRFLDAPVSVLDAATGTILVEALEGTQGADEMILDGGILIVKRTKKRSVEATQRIGPDDLRDVLSAVDLKTSKPLWQREDVRVVPYALSAQNGRVVYHDMEALVCLDAKTGKEVWKTPNVIKSTMGAVSTLVIHDGVVLFNGQGKSKELEGSGAKDPKKGGDQNFYLTALSLDNGKTLWQEKGERGWAGACTQPTDLFVIGGLVWCGSLEGRDLKTGQVIRKPEIGQLISPGHHYRCFRSKATDHFLILPKRGAEFVDVSGDQHMRNDWLRAPCFTGLTPANGLLYVPPSQCFCYPGVLVTGYQAMSARKPQALKPNAGQDLERGTAYGRATGAAVSDVDWPMYRHDGLRSGSTRTIVPADLHKEWEVTFDNSASQPVIVGERVWVAEKDAHRIRCLNTADGKEVWRFTAGGRIDSAPTVWNGLVIFGCRDGCAYALRATDGALAWRFRAAPDRRIPSFEQVESVWPVQGSVLVQDGVVYFAAGRSSFLDGGILVYGLEAATGKVLYHHLLEGPWPDVTKDTGTPFAMEGALPDLFVSDGKDLYMQRIKFDAKLNRLEVKQESPLGELDMGANHLVATGGFLDDTGFDRLYWMFSQRWPGFYFAQQSPKAGQLVVFDDRTTFAVNYFYRRLMWSPLFIPAEKGYLLFADDNDNQPILEEKGKDPKAINWLPAEAKTDQFRRGGRGTEKGTGYCREKPAKWQKMIPLRVRAMVLAGDRLFAAGLPDVVDAKDPWASFEGRKGAELHVYLAEDGTLLKSFPLSSPPVFDGLIAAHGKLYLTTLDGKMLCYGGTK